MASILSLLGGGGLTSAVGAVGNVLDQLFTSDEEKLDKTEAMARLAQQPGIAQIEINKIEASHRSVFVAGWRPFIGWVCGLALLYNFIVRDLLAWVMVNTGAAAALPPALQMEHLLTVLMGLLGLGGLRTIEKIAGRAR